MCLYCIWTQSYYINRQINAMTCAQAAAADTAEPGCAAWPSDFWVRGSEVGRQEERWRCASGFRWPRSPRCPSPPQTATLSAHPAHPAGREPRPAGSSGSRAASEAASARGDSNNDAYCGQQFCNLISLDERVFNYLSGGHVLERHPATDQLTGHNT